MMATVNNILQDPDFLLRLLRKETQEQVKAALMDVAEDVVNEVARKATEALGVRIQTALDEASSHFMVKVILEKREP